MAAMIGCPLAAGASACPEAPALVGADGSVHSYRQLHEVCIRLANRLPDWPAGTRVALVEPDRARLVSRIVACWYRGWVAVPLDHRMSEQAMAEVCAQLRLRRWPRLSDGTGGSGAGLRKRVEAGPTLQTCWRADHCATMTLTSGSTGAPKAVLHTFGNHAASAAGLRAALNLSSDSRWLLSLPLFHIGGLALLWRVWSAGGALVAPAAAPDTDLQRGVTHASLVPAQVLRLGTPPPEPVADTLMLGGEAVSRDVFARAAHWARRVVVSYGCSEATSTIALADSAGGGFACLPGREVTIREGAVWLGGPVLAAGYWDGEGVTPLDTGSGWRTGDGAEWLTPGRQFRLTGRLDRRFISGGENIQPEAIERVLLQCPGVERAVVVPVTDPVFGQRPVAFIHPAGGLRETELAAAVRQALPPYMCPEAWLPWPDPEVLKPPLKVWQQLAEARAARPEGDQKR